MNGFRDVSTRVNVLCDGASTGSLTAPKCIYTYICNRKGKVVFLDMIYLYTLFKNVLHI